MAFLKCGEMYVQTDGIHSVKLETRREMYQIEEYRVYVVRYANAPNVDVPEPDAAALLAWLDARTANAGTTAPIRMDDETFKRTIMNAQRDVEAPLVDAILRIQGLTKRAYQQTVGSAGSAEISRAYDICRETLKRTLVVNVETEQEAAPNPYAYEPPPVVADNVPFAADYNRYRDEELTAGGEALAYEDWQAQRTIENLREA